MKYQLKTIKETSNLQYILHSKNNLSDYKEYFNEEELNLHTAIHHDDRSTLQYHSSYYHNARFMLALKPLDCGNLCFCGVFDRRCKLTTLCSRCAYVKVMKKWKTYLGNYDQGNFYFLTISFKQDIPFNETTENFSIIWKRIHLVLSAIKEQKGIRGALVSDEFIVSRFLPLHILPHCHAIIDADDFEEEFASGMSEVIQEVIGLPVSIKYRKICDINEFKTTIGYMYKQIDFHLKYDLAYEEKIETGLCELYELNNEVFDVLEDIPCILSEYKILRGAAIGTFHHKAKNSLCIPKKEREKSDQELFKYVQSIDYYAYGFESDGAI